MSSSNNWEPWVYDNIAWWLAGLAIGGVLYALRTDRANPHYGGSRNRRQARGGGQGKQKQRGPSQGNVLQIPAVHAKTVRWTVPSDTDGGMTLQTLVLELDAGWVTRLEGGRIRSVSFADVFRDGDYVLVWVPDGMYDPDGRTKVEVSFRGRVRDVRNGVIDVLRSPSPDGSLLGNGNHSVVLRTAFVLFS